MYIINHNLTHRNIYIINKCSYTEVYTCEVEKKLLFLRNFGARVVYGYNILVMC